MTHSTRNSLSRGALRLATLFLATAPLTFAGEPAAPAHEAQLIGQMVVTAARDPQLLGHMVVTANRLAPTTVLVADLGHITVTAPRDTTLAQNDTSVADLGQMTVTARRDTALAQNDTSKVRRISF